MCWCAVKKLLTHSLTHISLHRSFVEHEPFYTAVCYHCILFAGLLTTVLCLFSSSALISLSASDINSISSFILSSLPCCPLSFVRSHFDTLYLFYRITVFVFYRSVARAPSPKECRVVAPSYRKMTICCFAWKHP